MTEPGIAFRPISRADVDEWYLAMVNSAEALGAHNWGGGTRSRRELIGRLGAHLDGHHGELVVEVDGEVAGTVSWRYQRWGPNARSWCPAIGIALLPGHRGRGLGSAAQRALAAHLFERFDINRVEADTASDNVAEQRALEKAGFTQEGVLRGCEWRDGRWHDHLLYSMLRDDAR